MTKKRSITFGLIAFVIALAVTTLIAVTYLLTAANARRERASFIVNSLADRIEAEIENREYITRILEIEAKSSNGDLTQEAFKTIGEALFNDYLDIVDITLAPNGVIEYIYPEDSPYTDKENLFDRKSENIYLENSKSTQLSIILTPVTLYDGSYGIVIRRPIFLSEDGEFWGFASVTLKLSNFLSEVSISGLSEEKYEYKLISNDIVTGESRVIMEYSEMPLDSPVNALISTVGGGFWELQIAPMGHWMDLGEILGVFAIAILFSVLIAFLIVAYLSLRANAKELEVLSYRDSLTDLYNPRSYQEHMEELTKKKLPYGLIYIDLNDFKAVNDTYGHETGDALLNIVAKRLQNSIREKDRAFRIGGDEFVVVIHGTHDKKFYEGVIARMRQNVDRDVVVGEISLKASISAGYARCPEDGSKFENVVKKADDAMYHNKRMIKARRLTGQEEGPVTSRDFR